jgi:tRNA A37 N6-isopentenylltransferase MiaA
MSAAKKATPPDAFCLMGPTASGKTALAIELLAHHPF